MLVGAVGGFGGALSGGEGTEGGFGTGVVTGGDGWGGADGGFTSGFSSFLGGSFGTAAVTFLMMSQILSFLLIVENAYHCRRLLEHLLLLLVYVVLLVRILFFRLF